MPHSKSSTVSLTVDNSGSTAITSGNTGSAGASADSKTKNTMDREGEVNTQDEIIKKMLSTPRKSICRIPAEDSLSTSSGNMFKEEEF